VVQNRFFYEKSYEKTMARLKRFSVIVVNFNQVKYLRTFIESLNVLFGEKIFDVQLTIVDNSGEVDVREVQSDILSSVKVLKNGNVGYLRGLVEGMLSSQTESPDIFVLCNPDIVFETAITKQDFEVVKAKGIVAPDIRDSSGTAQNPNRRSRMTKLEQLIWLVMSTSYEVYSALSYIKEALKKAVKHLRDAPDKSSDSSEIFLPHGSCMFVDCDLARRANWFDEDIFLWGEEAVIAGKCRENGGQVWFRPSIKVKHISHTSTGFISERQKFIIWRKSFSVYRRYLNR